MRRLTSWCWPICLVLVIAGQTQAAERNCGVTDWWLWPLFAEHFILEDGRVLDASTPQQHSSSEGQSYAMFFALIANDRDTFQRLWSWSVMNLASGDIEKNLPAWYWGRRDDGSWGVLDANSAADADMWFVYSLLEAGNRWQKQSYIDDAKHLLRNIEQREFAELPALGRMLLPGYQGFVLPDRLWVLNPSYLPLPLLRRLEKISPQGGWEQVSGAMPRLIGESSPKGFAPDWVGYRAVAPNRGVFVESMLKGGTGSYDAIRTYLWAGLVSREDPLAASVLKALPGMAKAVAVNGLPPEKVDIAQGTTLGVGSFGFSAALVPYLQAMNQPWLADLQQRRVIDELKLSVSPQRLETGQPPYYDFVLSLFALGWLEQQYSFRPDGGIDLKWEATCPRGATSSH
ncbi:MULTISPECIES: cellulose synthase complex periplasmic endoglucanase BcsZ [Pseudomonas putida group]|nr:cellulose synthase complex periplasmic endoglucanase BcsZ [Pseudomonas monteilii]BBV95149.1 endoglucanase [Pseudomonas monteilii]